MRDAIDPVRTMLLRLSQQSGVSLAALSSLLGRNPSYLQQFVRKGSPRRLAEQDRYRLAEFFGVDESALREEDGSTAQAPTRGRSDDWLAVRRIDIAASAGAGAIPHEETAFDSIRFSKRWLGEQGLERAELSAITVDGDSMEPLLNDGDEILVDCAPRAFSDGIHVLRLGDRLMVKRVASAGAGQFVLISENAAYPPVEAAADEMEIIGRVVWKGGRL